MLHKIVETKRAEVARQKKVATEQALLRQARTISAPRGFRRSLLESPRPVSVIAEIKKASPSKGVIRADFDPVSIARQYTAARVEAISVLTDETYFQGSLGYLEQVRAAADVPVLRKDFLIDEWQIIQSRACGADCVLLIAAILDGPRLVHFVQTAEQLGMDTLIEIHDRAELDMVLNHVTPSLLGINNRDLRTFDTQLETTARLLPLVPPEIPVVSESGIAHPHDISFLKQAGARAVLVGEHFMRQDDIRQAVLDLVGTSASEAFGDIR
ncbi:MAG: indole-3-glycerol phosphate synthase TrpC [Brevibacillus sp.]|nr:indole-3-glycerol phosphate synthase TrpC [Brevibacillus sp.]